MVPNKWSVPSFIPDAHTPSLYSLAWSFCAQLLTILLMEVPGPGIWTWQLSLISPKLNLFQRVGQQMGSQLSFLCYLHWQEEIQIVFVRKLLMDSWEIVFLHLQFMKKARRVSRIASDIGFLTRPLTSMDDWAQICLEKSPSAETDPGWWNIVEGLARALYHNRIGRQY